MSIPASLAASKLRMPETEEPLTAGKALIPVTATEDEEKPHNALQALTDGAWIGLKVVGMICTVVLVLISLVALIDWLLGWWAGYLGAPDLNLAQILGYLMFPVSFLCGITSSVEEMKTVGGLIGTKIVANEFVAVSSFGDTPAVLPVTDHSIVYRPDEQIPGRSVSPL